MIPPFLVLKGSFQGMAGLMGESFQDYSCFQDFGTCCANMKYRQIWHFRILKPGFQDF